MLVLGTIGCNGDADQAEAEALAARELSRCLETYTIYHPGARPTNLSQLYDGINRQYPYHLHERFLPFGKRKGFSNSFYEKYVFPAPGVTNPFMGAVGEVLFLNAQPYKDGRGTMKRRVFVETSKGYMLVTLPEDVVQQVFWLSKREIPKPSPMPRPPPKPTEDPAPSYTSAQRLRMLLATIAEEMGLGRGHWLTVPALIILLLLFGIGVLWLGLRKRGSE